MLKEIDLNLTDENGTQIKAQFSAILVRKSEVWARVFFIDDNSRTVFGKLRVRGRGKDGYIDNFVTKVMNDVQVAYAEEVARSLSDGGKSPSLLTVFPIIKTLVEAEIDKD